MSGICGVVGLDGWTPCREDIDPLVEQLKRRGPDGSHVWSGDGVILAHCLLATTSEALAEQLPLHHAESGCTITADVRLDNREDLFGKLGLTDEGRTIGDGELILRAYLKWGDACPTHLLGDFAFAIRDARQDRIFCARDHMGMRQLTYCHLPGRAFVFATEPRAVARHPLVPKELNKGRIGDFLDELECATFTETFYSAVVRLPPGHAAVVNQSGLRTARYWQLQMPPQLLLKTDAAYVEAFLDVFGKAVACRLRSVGKVGAMLSGGLDSGSVCAIAAEVLSRDGRGLLPTFSVAGAEEAKSEETLAILDSAQMPGIQPNIIRVSELDPYREDLVRLTKEEEEPFDCHMGLLRTVYLAAHRAGLKIVLDGVGGDNVLSPGTYLSKLLRSGHVREAWNQARGAGRFWNSRRHAWTTFARAAWVGLAPSRAIALRRRAVWWLRDRQIGRSGLISANFSNDSGLRERRRASRIAGARIEALDAAQRARSLANEILAVGRERYDRAASEVAIEPRDPFMDIRVIEFCLSLPWQQLENGGWPKILLRRAMAGKLSEFVRWRTGREHLGFAHLRAFFGGLGPNDVPGQKIREALAPYVRPEKLPDWPLNPRDEEDCKEWVDALCLYYWLKSVGRTLCA